jgi:hypothetical protein
MNYNDIYRKTPAGEEAMACRATAEERQQRVILALVDGKTSVGELSEKVGNHKLTESILKTLAARAFIALHTASDRASSPKVLSDKPKAAPAATPQAPLARGPAASQNVSVAAPVAPPARAVKAEETATAQSSFTLALNRNTISLDSHRQSNVSGHSTATPEEEDAERERTLSPWLWRTLWALGGILLLCCGTLAAIYLYPYNKERQLLEGWLAKNLGVPIRIGQLTPQLSPYFALELRQVQIGDASEQNRIEVVRLPGLLPRLLGLSPKTDMPVEISGGSLNVALLAAWQKNYVPSGMSHVRFRQMEIRLGEYTAITFEGEALLTQDGSLQHARLQNRSLQLEITPLDNNASAYQIAAQVDHWQPKPDSLFLIERFSGAIQVYPDRLRLEHGDIRLLGGHYKGNLEFRNKTREIRGEGTLSRIRIADLMDVMGYAKPTEAADGRLELAGNLAGALRFHTRGDTLELWRKNLEAHGALQVDAAVLQGMDLVRLMRGGGKGKVTRQKGLTRFSQLDFTMSINNDGLKLDNLKLRATSVRGEGSVSISPEGKASGQINLLLFNGEGSPSSALTLDGHYPNLTSELH